MSILSINSSHFSNKNQHIRDILSIDNLNQMAKGIRLARRDRKMIFGSMFNELVAMVSGSNKPSTVCVKELYRRFCKNNNVLMSNTAFQDAISKEEMVTFCKTLLNEVYASISRLNNTMNSSLLFQLAKRLNVDDIVAIDGVEIPLSSTCLLNKKMKEIVATKQEGSAAFKLHIAYSIKHKRIVYMDMTEPLKSERDHVHADLLKNSLVLMDRGYESQDLFCELDEAGVYYVCRAKNKKAGQAEQAFSTSTGLPLACTVYNGSTITGLQNKARVKKRDYNVDVDFTFNSDKSKRKYRIVAIKKPSYASPKEKDDYGLYFTNIPRGKMNAEGIYLLYRLRWQVELMAKSLKQGCSLGGINSSKEEINFLYITACLVAAAVKLFYGLTAFKHDIEAMSLLKVFKVFGPFQELIRKFAQGYKTSSICAEEKRLRAELLVSGARQKPSARDIELMKDMPTLLRSILCNHKKCSSAYKKAGFMVQS